MSDLRPKNLLFKEQVDWVRELVQWAEKRQDVFLLIRPHPRELPNKREGQRSQHVERLTATLAEVPSNVRVNWPSDNISIYDLALETDLLLNSWSAVGTELLLYGVPVVLYSDELALYNSSLNTLAKTQEEYFAAIDRCLKEPYNVERIQQGMRWFNWFFNGMTFDISDASRLKTVNLRSKWEDILHTFDEKLSGTWMRKWDIWTRRRPAKESKLIGEWMGSQTLPLDSIKKFRYPQVSPQNEKHMMSWAVKRILELQHIEQRPSLEQLPRVKWLRSVAEGNWQ